VTDTDGAVDAPPTDDLYASCYYAEHLGVPYGRREHWTRFFGAVADRIVAALDPTTVLDVGCAFGYLVEALRDRDVDASGTDVSEYALSQVAGSAVGHCELGSATDPIEGRYDLITCVEVVEHLSPDDGRQALTNMTGATDRVLLSTTPSDHAEPTHLNVRPVEYWAEILAELGFYRDVDHDASYLTPWAGLFVRRDDPVAQVVRDYERSDFRLREEVVALRAAVLDVHGKVARAQTTDARGDLDLQTQLRIARDAAAAAEAEKGATAAELAVFQGELNAARGHQEIWDTLIGRLEGIDPAQLGVGRTEADDLRIQLEELKASRTWRIGRSVLAPYRWLRRRP
jgi:SAM-dependent methyltransferase